MTQLQAVGTIRQRGQLTIPESIRDEFDWAIPGSVVTIISEKPDEISIRPYSAQKQVDWNKLWKQIERVRSFKGRGKPVSLSEFIAKDRQTHF